MRAAVVGRVQHVDVARLHLPGVLADHGLDRLAHRAQVHRHVRRIGDQVALGVEQRAGEIEPLLDVHRVRGVLQPQAHLLGDRHEEVVEDLQHHRVDRGADAPRSCFRGCVRSSTRWFERRDLGAPAGLDHGRGVRLGDDRRAVDALPGREVLAPVERRLVPAAAGEHAHASRPASPSPSPRTSASSANALACRDRLHRHRLDDRAACPGMRKENCLR